MDPCCLLQLQTPGHVSAFKENKKEERWLLLKNSAVKQTPVCDHSGLTEAITGLCLAELQCSGGRYSQALSPPQPPGRPRSYTCVHSTPRRLCAEAPLSEAWAQAFPRHLHQDLLPGPWLRHFLRSDSALSTLTFPRSLSQTLQIHKKAGSSGMIVSPICAAPLPEAVPWERVDTGGQGHAWPLAYRVTINK